ncbi:MAG TPA: asparaginase domain-containing protein [Devosiaceae bacterium]|nr:asparaginase domain-containing protein [Devosiaceae bacterium]
MTKQPRVRIAHLAGPTATIQNTPPLVTSNKARAKHNLPPRGYAEGAPAKFDALRAQRLAAPAKVYVEQFSAHPLEADSAHLYGKPDGYIGADGVFRTEQLSEADKPVYEIELKPEDGLYPLPYMATQADGSPWEDEMAEPGGPDSKARQGFFPDGSRSFEEIDRLSINTDGSVNAISQQADIDFYRVLPPGGFRNGLASGSRADEGGGDIAAETRGVHFYGYKPYHLSATPTRPTLAKITNDTQAIADSGKYDGLIWTQGSPQVEEAAYWFNLLIDTSLPICGNAAQRPQGQISNDGPKNIVDSVAFIRSKIWADGEGRNRCGTVVIQEQQFFAAREVAKVDARPGGYVATGGHGGILGQISHADNLALMYVPAYKHTYLSDVNIHKLPTTAKAAKRVDGRILLIDVAIKDGAGKLLADAVPSVSIIKEGSFSDEDFSTGPDDVPEMLAAIEHKLSLGRLSGFVTEGLVPYGRLPSNAKEVLALRATFMGIPFVRVGRGAPEGFADPSPFAIAGSNLTATKARLLLMAALMKLGALPLAADPDHPTETEKQATIAAIKSYQEIYDTH